MRSGSVLEAESGEKPVVLAWLGEVVLLGRYWARKRSIERVNGYTYFYWKPNKIGRRVALAGMFAIPILSIASFYAWQHLPSKDIIVLLADFEGSSEQKNYRVTKNIFDKLEDAIQNSRDVKIQRLNKAITERRDALSEGKSHKATIVIWGDLF